MVSNTALKNLPKTMRLCLPEDAAASFTTGKNREFLQYYGAQREALPITALWDVASIIPDDKDVR